MALNNALGLTYRIPQSFIGAQPAEQEIAPAKVQPALPKIDEDLAFVEGLTDRYYNTWGQIKSFVEEMNRQGIDVTKPDYTQTGGGELFRTYNKLVADLQMTSNDLRQTLERNKSDQAAVRQGAYQTVEDPNQPLSNRREGTGFSTKLFPQVSQTLEITQRPVYSQADYNRVTSMKQGVINDLTQMMNQTQDPIQKAQIQYNIDALVQAPQAARTTPYSEFSSRGKEPTFEIDLLKNTTNLAQGVWPQGTYKTEVMAGEPVLVSKAREGEQFGEFTYQTKSGEKRAPRLIDRWVKKPDGVYLYFKNTDEGGSVPPIKVSEMSGDAVTSTLISSNPKYGDVRKMYESARKMGLLDETSQAVTERLLPANAEQIRQQGLDQFGGISQSIQAESQRIASQVSNLGRGDDPVTLSTPGGAEIKIKKNYFGSGYYITVDGKEVLNNEPVDVIMDYLLKNTGYFNSVLNKPATGETDRASQIKAKYGIK